jgi:hypothetical protein
MRNSQNHSNASARRIRSGLAAGVCALAACVLPASALGATDTTSFSVNAGSLSLASNPNVPDTLGTLTLNGQAQSLSAQMNNFSISDATGSGSGYNVTVAGNNAAGKSPVFKQFDGTNYGSYSLPANSLTLNSTGAGFSAVGGSSGSAPTHQCNSGCFVDASPGSPVKVVSAASGAGMGTFATTGYSSSSLGLSTPSNLRALGAGENYQLDIVWSLNSGP